MLHKMNLKEPRLSGLKQRVRGTLLLPSATAYKGIAKTKPSLSEVCSECQKTKNSN